MSDWCFLQAFGLQRRLTAWAIQGCFVYQVLNGIARLAQTVGD